MEIFNELQKKALVSVAIKCKISSEINKDCDFIIIYQNEELTVSRGHLHRSQVNDFTDCFSPMTITKQVYEFGEYAQKLTTRTVDGIICVKTNKRSVSPVFYANSDLLVSSFGLNSGVFVVSHLLDVAPNISEGNSTIMESGVPFSIYNGDRENDSFSLIIKLASV